MIVYVDRNKRIVKIFEHFNGLSFGGRRKSAFERQGVFVKIIRCYLKTLKKKFCFGHVSSKSTYFSCTPAVSTYEKNNS